MYRSQSSDRNEIVDFHLFASERSHEKKDLYILILEISNILILDKAKVSMKNAKRK